MNRFRKFALVAGIILVLLAASPVSALAGCLVQGTHDCCKGAGADCEMHAQRSCCEMNSAPATKQSDSQLPPSTSVPIAPPATAVALVVAIPVPATRDLAASLPLPQTHSSQSVLCSFLI